MKTALTNVDATPTAETDAQVARPAPPDFSPLRQVQNLKKEVETFKESILERMDAVVAENAELCSKIDDLAVTSDITACVSVTPTSGSLSDILHKDDQHRYTRETDSLEAISASVASAHQAVLQQGDAVIARMDEGLKSINESLSSIAQFLNTLNSNLSTEFSTMRSVAAATTNQTDQLAQVLQAIFNTIVTVEKKADAIGAATHTVPTLSKEETLAEVARLLQDVYENTKPAPVEDNLVDAPRPNLARNPKGTMTPEEYEAAKRGMEEYRKQHPGAAAE